MRLRGLGTRRRPCASRLSAPSPPTHRGDGSAGSLLGFWRRPLQGGQRRLQEWRVITSRLESIHSDALHTFLCYC